MHLLSFNDLNSILVLTTYQAKLLNKVFAMPEKTKWDETVKDSGCCSRSVPLTSEIQ